MTLNYAGYSTLVSTTWTATNGEFYGNTITPQFTEKIIFGAETIGVGFKTIACEYQVKDAILIGYLYVPEDLITKFVFSGAEKINSSFDLTGGVLTIFSKDVNVSMSYV
jgi:hypothetical protein